MIESKTTNNLRLCREKQIQENKHKVVITYSSKLNVVVS